MYKRVIISIGIVLGALSIWSYTLNDWKLAYTRVKSQTQVTSQTQESSKSDVTSVLLLTYMRSGSSLTGDLLQQAPGAFYIYEPLHALYNWFSQRGNTSLTYVNGTLKPPPLSRAEESVHVLYNWLTCDLSKLPLKVFTDSFLKFGLKSKSFNLCIKNETLRSNGNWNDVAFKCVTQLESICRSSPFRILKTIRTEMRQISHFLELLPDLKIIYLVRDPRATLQSRSLLGGCKGLEASACASSYCVRRENDVIEVDRLVTSYPDRVYTVTYESIALDPLTMAKRLHEMIGAQYTQKARQYTFNITMAGLQDSCVICTTRSNSSEHVYGWKSKISKSLLDAIQDRCHYILKRFNHDFVTE